MAATMSHTVSQREAEERGLSHQREISPSARRISNERLLSSPRIPNSSADELIPAPLTPRRVPLEDFGPNATLGQWAAPVHVGKSRSTERTGDSPKDSGLLIAVPGSNLEPFSNNLSPYSSTHSSIVGHEDASPTALRSKLSPPPQSTKSRIKFGAPSLEYKTTDAASRGAIQIMDEAIASIEATNRQLLARAIAAENAIRILRKQNSILQRKLQMYTESKDMRKRDSGTVPIQQVTRTTYHRTTSSLPTPAPISMASTHWPIGSLSLSNPELDSQPDTPKLHRPVQTSQVSSQPTAKPSLTDLNPLACHTQLKGQTVATDTEPPTSTVSQISGLLTSWCNKQTKVTEISPPIAGSVQCHEVFFEGMTIPSQMRARNISLDEARRREKPLPPLSMEVSMKHETQVSVEVDLNIEGTGERKWVGVGLGGLFSRRKVK